MKYTSLFTCRWKSYQCDMTHIGHVDELTMFYCIGHTGYEINYTKKLECMKEWDHIHPWMTLERHLKQGFTKEHALELLNNTNT